MRHLVIGLLLCLLPLAQVSPANLSGSIPSVVSGQTFLTDATITDLSGAGFTNAPFMVGMPFSATAIDSSHSLNVVDQDTGSSVLCDEPNRASDVAPAVRFEALRCIIPSATASEAKALKVYVTAGAPASGTDISAANITGTAYDCPVSLTKINGSTGTWTASPLDALNSGNSGWVNTTTATVLGKTMTGGGIVTGYELFVPFKKSGVADAQLHAIFHLEAFKAARSAVGGGNPILSIDTDVVIENAYENTASPIDQWYGADFSGCGGVNLANSTPAIVTTFGAPVSVTIGAGATVTGTCAGISANQAIQFSTTGSLPTGIVAGTTYFVVGSSINCGGSGSFQFSTTPSGSAVTTSGTQSGQQYVYPTGIALGGYPVRSASNLFTANSLGQVIADGTGVAVINGFTDATHAQVNIYEGFSSAALGSGAYTLYGTNHPYGARFIQKDLWWVPSGSKPNTQSALGVAWNAGTKTGGPFSYIASTKMILNYIYPASSACPTDLTNLNALGTNPMAYINGGGIFGFGGTMGDLLTILETSGGRPDIGPMPDWDVDAMICFDSNALTRVYGNAQRWATLPINFRDHSTGLPISPCNAGSLPTCTGTTSYVMVSNQTGTYIHNTADLTNQTVPMISPWQLDGFAHDPEDFYAAYLLSGKQVWVENQQFSGAFAWFTNDAALNGAGINRSVYSNDGLTNGVGTNGLQERGRVWATRTITDTALLTPDSTTTLVAKASFKQLMENQWNGTNGLIPNYVNDTGVGKTFNTDGIRGTANNNNSFSMYQMGYGCYEFNHEREQGMLSADGLTALGWYCELFTSMINDNTQVQPQDLWMTWFETYYDTSSTCPGTDGNTGTKWQNAYQYSATHPYTGSIGIGTQSGRNPNTTLTLSGTHGSVTATLGGGNYFGGGGSFYVGGWISALPLGGIGGGGGGRCQITAINNANQAVCDTTASHTYYVTSCTAFAGVDFGATSYTAGNFAVPEPAPGDPVGLEFTTYLTNPPSDTGQLAQSSLLMMSQAGDTGASAACATVWGYTNSNAGCGVQPSNQTAVKWVVGPR